MWRTRTIWTRILILVLLLSSFGVVNALYVPTNRDTKLPPDHYDYIISEPTEMQLLKETSNLTYYFRESRDTIFIYDKRNGYTWKTGTDLEFNWDIEDECDDILDAYEDQFSQVSLDTFPFMTIQANESSEAYGSNGELRVDVQGLQETSATDTVKIDIPGITLQQNHYYRFSFDARGLASKTVRVQLGSYYAEDFVITSTDQTFSFDYRMESPTDTDVTVQMLMGTIEDNAVNTILYIDDIKLEETNSIDVVPNTNQLLRGDFELTEDEYAIQDDHVLASCRDKEVRLNTTYTGFANSLLSIEYYDSSFSIRRHSSASYEDATSSLTMVNNDDTHYALHIAFRDPDIEVILHIYLDEEGIEYEVRDSEVTGEDVDVLAAIIISPFLGSSGGAYTTFDLAELDYQDNEIFKEKIPGYTFVPDGSGALIRFNDNDVELAPYEGSVYGIDRSLERLYNDTANSYVEFKQPSLPVFGIAHGDNQSAFVAYATKGDEFMQIVSVPEDNLTYYNYTYPRFEYNNKYKQVYNKMGWGYTTLYEERSHFDINMRYDFLAGDGTTGHSADYFGMALQYRQYLQSDAFFEEHGYRLSDVTFGYDEIPVRVDFLMSDSEKSVIGYQNMVTTSVDGVDRILENILSNLEISNVNSGLLGWNDGGMTLGNPSKTDFSKDIGRKSEFESLILKYRENGVDISFQDDYYRINEEMITLRNNATQHINTWYPNLSTSESPISMFYFARPVKSVEWMNNHVVDFKHIGVQSHSVSGITSNLITDMTTEMYRTESKQTIIDGFRNLQSDVKINAYSPNSYLWPFVDRYIGTPVYGTQYLIETDTVPFLQIVLQGTMELYGPYANFSFYTTSDVLRMIDYNIFPNFVISDQPAYLLADTNSKNFYSTEYSLHSELIQSIHNDVNNALSSVINARWIDRTVSQNGVIVNTYSNGIEIIINYTDEPVLYGTVTVPAESYQVVGD